MDAAFRRELAAARRHGDLCFAGLRSEECINAALGEARSLWQGWICTPAVTVWVFLSQCLSPDHSCREALAGLIAWRLARRLRPCSADTGAYCTARAKLPEAACQQLARETGRQLDDEAPAEWRWLGHRVHSVDGSTLTMPDTAANQAAYPQQSGQRPGCGFPLARIVVVFSLAVGTVLDAAIGKYQGKQTGENRLFRTLHEVLREDDVVLADRYFSGWFDIALPRQRQVHSVVRKHQLRATDFRTGHRLGPNDHLVQVKKPARPEWMSHEQYATLLDAQQYPAQEIAALFRRRWQAELNLRSLKTVLPMDHLRCKSPERVRNEFFMHLTAYNLIRRLMALAVFRAGVTPWTVSFKGTLQTINRWLPLLDTHLSTETWCDALLTAIATHAVDDRPDRYEPRVKKRRPKNYPLMRKPPDDYKRRAA
jgi:hypothetical protein